MFGHQYYHEHLRRYVVVFGTMFNNIVVTRKDSNGVVQKRIKVPVAYSPREKLLSRVEEDPNFRKPTAIDLPYIGFEMTSMTYAGERKMNTVSRYTAVDSRDPSKRKITFAPVPYDINFSMTIMVKSAEDGTQILEQILPFFTPEWTNSVRLVDDLDIIMDVPLVLVAVSSDDSYDGDFETRRALMWNLDFVMKAHLFGPIKDKKVIKFSKTKFFVDGFDDEVGTTNTAISQVTIQPGLIPTANLSGTIQSSNIVVTGSATTFTDDFIVGNYLIADNQFKRVVSIANNTSMIVDSTFSTNLVSNTYQSTFNGTGTSNASLTIDKEFIVVTDNWDYITEIEDA